MTEPEIPQRQYQVLVYGLERKQLPVPAEPLRERNFTILFESFNTARRLQEFDGVVMFQGVFEKFERKTGSMDSYLSHTHDVDELDKRKKEVALLLAKGGFVTFLLTEPFIDRDNRRDFRATDLAKSHLNYSGVSRNNFSARIAHIAPIMDEFKRFLEVFGAAWSYFESHNSSLDYRVLAKVTNASVGVVLQRSEYFVPSLVPDARLEVVKEYFGLLVDAITSTHNKIHQAVPEWVEAYAFHEEGSLSNERKVLAGKIKQIDHRLQQLSSFKASLVHTGQELVSDVTGVLVAALDLKVDAADQLREDVKLLDRDGKVVCVAEIKGVNRGIKREHINQTDSHRERSGFDGHFPALLVANTNIKSARSIAEKDQEVATEQVRHAVHMRVLVMRTIDLLGLLRLVLAGKLTTLDACSLVLSNTGWLRVQSDEVRLVTGEEAGS